MTTSPENTAFLIGAFPSAAMLLAILLLTRVEISSLMEACVQNFAAGLILAAVAGEIFPILMGSSTIDASIGITLGFVIGLGIIYGLEAVVEFVENLPSENTFEEIVRTINPMLSESNSGKNYQSITVPKDIEDVVQEEDDHLSQVDEFPLASASAALTTPEHRNHIEEHIKEVMRAIDEIESHANQLSVNSLSVQRKEELAETIDEQVHSVQYKIDHIRRLLQGSETLHSHGDGETWVTEDRRQGIIKGIKGLKHMARHLQEHIISPHEIDTEVVKELHLHIKFMDRQLTAFHHHIESVGSRWHRARELIPTSFGDKLPLGLIVPVFMDSFVDGFLMGISSSISLKAGIVLSFANCLEMSFLGMAYATRLVKCTGSSRMYRLFALYSPPVIMFLAAGLGGYFGAIVEDSPAVFMGLVSFGAVALLFLVCNELLIEARNAQGEDEKWWISAMVFVGIYVVLMMNHIL